MTEDLQQRVRSAFQARTAGVPEPARPDWTAADRRRARRTRFAPLMASVAVLVVAAVVVLIGVGVERSHTKVTSPLPAPAHRPTLVDSNAAGACAAHVPSRVLPTWARRGFTAAEPRMPYVLGARGDIAAILFGDPLAAPPRRDLANKILWVSRDSSGLGGPLIIQARRDGSRTVVTRTVPGGPGPSIIDLPHSGCWHLTLTWAQHSDTMDLRYSRQKSR